MFIPNPNQTIEEKKADLKFHLISIRHLKQLGLPAKRRKDTRQISKSISDTELNRYLEVAERVSRYIKRELERTRTSDLFDVNEAL
jgi:hypothetical protein